MADDAATKKKASADAGAAAAAPAVAWPTGGYDSFIPYLLVHVLAVYMLFIDGSVLCTVRAHMLTYRYEMHTVFSMFTVYSWIRLFEKVLIFTTQVRTRLQAQVYSSFVEAEDPRMIVLVFLSVSSFKLHRAKQPIIMWSWATRG